MNSRRFCAGTPGQMPMTHGEVATRVTAVVSSIGSNGMSFCSTALTTCAPTTIATTWPSGGDLTITSVPMMPFAPGRFSTSTCWPHVSCMRAASARLMMSVPPPGVYGTMMRTGLDGNWAFAAKDKSSPSNNPHAVFMSGFYAVGLRGFAMRCLLIAVLMFASAQAVAQGGFFGFTDDYSAGTGDVGTEGEARWRFALGAGLGAGP